MAEESKPDPDAEQAPGRMMRFASGVAENLDKYQASRPIAKVDAGTARLGQVFGGSVFVLYPDRIKTPKGEHPLTASVHAEVDSAGGFKKKIDKRELYLNIEGDGWSISHQCERRKGEKVRAFAHAVNAAVRALSAAKQDPPAQAQTAQAPRASDAADAIRKLGELRDAGVLTEEEFDAKKRELLHRM
jgi:hypothetical protein